MLMQEWWLTVVPLGKAYIDMFNGVKIWGLVTEILWCLWDFPSLLYELQLEHAHRLIEISHCQYWCAIDVTICVSYLPVGTGRSPRYPATHEVIEFALESMSILHILEYSPSIGFADLFGLPAFLICSASSSVTRYKFRNSKFQ